MTINTGAVTVGLVLAIMLAGIWCDYRPRRYRRY